MAGVEIGFSHIIELVKAFGLPGLVLIIWWIDRRTIEGILNMYRDATAKKDVDNDQRMNEMRAMYENNVDLVKITQRLATDHKDVLLMVSQVMQKVCDDIRSNQYCPNVRLKKDAKGVQE
jgi:hypothetical protein